MDINYYYGGYYTYIDSEIPHVFVNVSLTEEGQKFVVENPTIMREDYAKVVKHNEDYKEELPDYMNATDNTYDELSADSGKDKEVVEAVAEEVYSDSDTLAIVEEVVEEVENPKPTKEVKEDKNAKYNSLRARVKSETVNVLLGRFKVIKIMDVCCSEDMFKQGVATCNVVYTFADPTPFGYVLSEFKPDYYLFKNCQFRLYKDTGWVVEKIDD